MEFQAWFTFYTHLNSNFKDLHTKNLFLHHNFNVENANSYFFILHWRRRQRLSGIVLSCEYKREWRQIQINVRQYEYMAELQTM